MPYIYAFHYKLYLKVQIVFVFVFSFSIIYNLHSQKLKYAHKKIGFAETKRLKPQKAF